MAPAATASATPLGSVPQSTTTGRGVGGEERARARRRARAASGAAPTGQEREAVARRGPRAGWSASGGTSAPGREPAGDARAVGLGEPERGGRVAGQVDEERAVGSRRGRGAGRAWRRRRWCPRRPSTTSTRRASGPPMGRPRRCRGGRHRGKPSGRRAAAVVAATVGDVAAPRQGGRSAPGYPRSGDPPPDDRAPRRRLLRPRQDGDREGVDGGLQPAAPPRRDADAAA